MKTFQKRILLVVCLILAMSLVACVKKEASKETFSTNQVVKKSDPGEIAVPEKKGEFTYSIIDETYTERGINLKFTQLTKANNPTKADSINKAIQENIRGILDSLRSEGKDMGALTLDLNYELAGYGQKVMSISYQGYVHFEQAPNPFNVYHTQNIALGDVIPFL